MLVGMGSFWWTEVLWYDSVGYLSVLWTQLGAQALLFLLGTLVVAALVASSLLIAYHRRPVYAPATPQQEALDRYRELIEPLRRFATVIAPLLLGVFAGAAAASQWKTMLLWRNAQDFGVTDPTFGRDVGFFVFSLPWWRFLESYLTMALVLAIMAAAFTHYVYGGVQFGGDGAQISRVARIHLSVLAAAFVLVRAIGYYLDRFSLSVQDSERITGLTYTDHTAVLPTKSILAVAAVICALLFLATFWTSSWRLPVIGVSLLLVTSLVVGGIYPAVVQSLRVRPNEQQLESPYIAHGIQATRAAYGLDQIDERDYAEATVDASEGLQADLAAVMPGIRVLDPLIVSATFKQWQGLKQFYDFPDALDVDRYTIDGKVQDTVVAVRELDLANAPQRNWVNDHTVYTHGFGVVAAYGNRRGSQGAPDFFLRDLPPSGPIKVTEPRIYFGERSPEYSIVGAPEGSPPRELDYEDAGGRQVNYTYTGDGGVAMSNALIRTAYAVKYREAKLLLSEQVSDSSRMLDYRSPIERVERVAPWLTLDGNPYPSVVGGRVLWIIDGYTTSSTYPYSKLQQIDQTTSDAVTQRVSSVQSVRGATQVNYIRNSVKATVDAYDGSVQLYTWDDQDPVLKAWSGAFGNTVRPMSEISGELMAHVRYPEDLFKVQRDLLTRFHISDPGAFYNGSDYWRVPGDPTRDRGAQPPYYLSVKMPDAKQATFSLTTSFSPAGENRPFLAGFLAVDSDAGSTAGKKRDGYGKLQLLKLPPTKNVPGPQQVQNNINASPVNSVNNEFSWNLSQFLGGQSGVTIERGNLLTLPAGGGLLYVQPVYTRSSNGWPQMSAVITVFGGTLTWARDVPTALAALTKTSGTTPQTPPEEGGTATPTPTAPATPGTPPSGDLQKAVADIRTNYAAAEAAMKKGDWAAYGQAQARLKTAIDTAVRLAPSGSVQLPGSGAQPSAPASAQATARPSGAAPASQAPATASGP